MQTTNSNPPIYTPQEAALRRVLKRSGYLWFDRPTAALQNFSRNELIELARSLHSKDDRVFVSEGFCCFQGREPEDQSELRFWERGR